MSEDSELDRLKAKRLAEMRKNIESKANELQNTTPEPKPKTMTPRDLLVSRLGFRGLEVLENAESQFPKETGLVVIQLAQLLQSGEINETIDGGQLLALFRAIGLGVRVATKINIEQDGKFVSLGDKLKNSSDTGDD